MKSTFAKIFLPFIILIVFSFVACASGIKKQDNAADIVKQFGPIERNIDVSRDSLNGEIWQEVEKNEIVELCLDATVRTWETSLKSAVLNDSCLVFKAPTLIGVESINVYLPESDSSHKINLAVGMKYLNSLKDFDLDEPIDMMVVSPFEFGESINYSYFFVSKLGCSIREVYFPVDSSTIWDKCDVLITANPKLLDSKPEGKKTVRIEKEYNKDSKYDFTFKSLSEFLTNEDNTNKLIESCGVIK